jgi:hypothetical protein
MAVENQIPQSVMNMQKENRTEQYGSYTAK